MDWQGSKLENSLWTMREQFVQHEPLGAGQNKRSNDINNIMLHNKVSNELYGFLPSSTPEFIQQHIFGLHLERNTLTHKHEMPSPLKIQL